MKLCVIPARGGSKRILRKNIKEFCGKPIIGYSIEVAITSGCFDKVIVSTDDAEIAEVARSFGAEVPFIRPEDLSNDFAGTVPVVKHAIEWFEENNEKPSDVCCLYATAPFLQAKSLQKAYQQMKSSQSQYCFSVTSYAYPVQRALMIASDSKVDMFDKDQEQVRSQDLREAFHDAGQFYWGSSSAWRSEKPIFSESSSAFQLPRYLVQDIDNLEDWRRAEVMFEVLKKQGLL